MADSNARKDIITETVWILYYYLSLKANKITTDSFTIGKTIVDEKYITSSIEKNGLDDLISTFALQSHFKHLQSDVSECNREFKGDKNKTTKFFITSKWHKALVFQCKKFKINQKTSFVKRLDVCRQEYFYKQSGIDDFMKKVFELFSIKRATLDRWNPADVWFYDPSAISQIKSCIDLAGINVKSLERFKKREKKVMALSDVIALNKLFLKLYKSHQLCPISLKKASDVGKPKNYFSFRLIEQNTPKTKEGKPRDPVVQSKIVPVEFLRGGKYNVNGKLEYEIKCQVPILNTNGTIKYRSQTDTISYISLPSGSSSLKIMTKGFSAAAGGSTGLDVAENIIYNAQAARYIKNARKISPDLYSENIISNTKSTDADSQLRYLGTLGKALNPQIRDESVFAWDKATTNYSKSTSERSQIQKKVEIATAIKLSGKEDELILDLWGAAGSKKVTNRKDYEVMIEKVSNVLYKRSQKPGQTRLTRSEADLQAKLLIKSYKLEGNPLKIPGGFHLKLY